MKIFEAKNHILIHSKETLPLMHRHMAAHIIVSLGADITLSSQWQSITGRGMMIPAGVSHKVNTYGADTLVFLYDCTTFVSKQIKQVRTIPPEICTEIKNLYNSLKEDADSKEYYKFENTCHSLMGIYSTDYVEFDERITDAMKYIQSNIEDNLNCKKAAEHIYLSQGRFSHLFKENVGMTFSAYLIYQRLMYVYHQIIKGSSITDASLIAGFSSSSHFADVNRRIFGISASSIIQNLNFIKIE